MRNPSMTFTQFKSIYQKREVEHYPSSVGKQPKVSVIVAAYQHAKFVKQCLDSILNQKTKFDFEILIGEDGSSDGTREICIQYAKEHPEVIRLFLHQRENNIRISGRPSGRFNALYSFYEAKGEFLAICEGDDFWTDPNKLQKQVNYLKSDQECRLVSHNMSEINETLKQKSEKNKLRSKMNFEFFALNGCGGIYTCSMLFRNEDWLKKVILTYGAPSYDGLDHIILLAASKGGRTVRVLDDYMATYRIHTGGMWTSGDKKKQALYNLRNYKLYSRFVEFSELEKKKLLLITTRALSWLNRNSVSGQAVGSIRKVFNKLFEVMIHSDSFPFKIKHLLIKCFLSIHSDRIRREYRNLGQ